MGREIMKSIEEANKVLQNHPGDKLVCPLATGEGFIWFLGKGPTGVYTVIPCKEDCDCGRSDCDCCSGRCDGHIRRVRDAVDSDLKKISLPDAHPLAVWMTH